MADRALFIGVGGSGGATLQYLYNDLESRLRELKWEGGVPDAWQFLHIDATSNPDEGDRVVAQELRDSRHYLPLAAKETKYEDYTRRIINNEEVAGGWLPGPTSAPQRLHTGAGQRRAIGRVLVLEGMEAIYGRVKDLINETQRPESRTQLSMLSQGPFQEVINVDGDLAVFVIASLGGGSGSGMHQDISLMLRAAFSEADRHVSILYPADIFDSIDAGFRTGVVPNSLAGISEILSAHFGEGKLTPAEIGGLRGVPVANFSVGSRAPHLTFFQGRSNGEITLDTPGDVYRSTARALSAMLLNKENREQLKSYVQANLSPVPSRREFLADESLLSGAPDWQLGMAFGYANVSLGMTAFKEYGAQRLASLVLDQVQDTASNNSRLRSEHDAGFAEKARKFAVAAGLDESSTGPGSGRGGITSAWVEPETLVSVLKKTLEKVADEPSRLKRSADTAGRDESSKKKHEFIVNLQTRVDRATDRLVTKTLASVASDGADATVQYLAQLEEDLAAAANRWGSGGGARTSQPTQRQVQGQQPAVKGGLISKLVGGIRGENAPASSPVTSITQSLAGVIAPLRADFEKYQLDAIVYTLQGLAVNVVKPVREALEGGRQELAGRLAADVGLRRKIGAWAGETGGSTIHSQENEVFLIDDSDFKEQFENLLTKSLSPLANVPFPLESDADFESSEKKSRDAMISYESVRSQAVFEVLGGSGQRLNEPTMFWNSSVTGDRAVGNNTRLAIRQEWDLELNPDGVPPRQVVERTDTNDCLKVNFSIDPDQLLADAREWMNTRVGVISFTNMSLSDYLYSEGAESLQRRSDFLAKFSTAINMARPMTEINAGALRAYHGFDDEVGCSTAVSVIPLLEGSEEANSIVSLLTREKMSEGEIHFSADNPAPEIHITRYLSRQVHPVDMVNVMAPIVREWEMQRSSEVNDSLFWACRRAHRIPSFVPLAPSVLNRLVKGWNLARSTQLISDDAVTNYLHGDAPLSITAHGATHSFPERLLTAFDIEKQSDLFPALLEGFSVALIDIAAGRPDTIEAYAALSEIGRNSRTLIAEYLQTGSLAGSVVYLDAAETQEDRLKRLHDEVQSRRNGLGELVVAPGSRADDRSQFGLTWELRDVTLSALDALLGEITAPPVATTLKA